MGSTFAIDNLAANYAHADKAFFAEKAKAGALSYDLEVAQEENADLARISVAWLDRLSDKALKEISAEDRWLLASGVELSGSRYDHETYHRMSRIVRNTRVPLDFLTWWNARLLDMLAYIVNDPDLYDYADQGRSWNDKQEVDKHTKIRMTQKISQYWAKATGMTSPPSLHYIPAEPEQTDIRGEDIGDTGFIDYTALKFYELSMLGRKPEDIKGDNFKYGQDDKLDPALFKDFFGHGGNKTQSDEPLIYQYSPYDYIVLNEQGNMTYETFPVFMGEIGHMLALTFQSQLIEWHEQGTLPKDSFLIEAAHAFALNRYYYLAPDMSKENADQQPMDQHGQITDQFFRTILQQADFNKLRKDLPAPDRKKKKKTKLLRRPGSDNLFEQGLS